MKKIITIITLIIIISNLISCDSSEDIKEWECGTHNGETLYKGPQGGCYYKNSNGNKTYVDRSECNC